MELRKITDHSFEQIAHVVGGISRNAVKLLLAVLCLFFVYRDGRSYADQLARALEQLLGPRVHNYLQAIGQTVKAVVYGLVLAAAVQGTLAGLGYWVAGVGAPVFLAALTTVCGLIPFAAPALWGGVGVWLVVTGNTVAGVGLLVWGAIVVGWTDHIVRPFLISREAQIPFLVVMFGVLGGLAAFGLVGLFVGPVILGGAAGDLARVAAGERRAGRAKLTSLLRAAHAPRNIRYAGLRGLFDVGVVQLVQVLQELRPLGRRHLDAGEHAPVVRAVIAVVEQADVPA